MTFLRYLVLIWFVMALGAVLLGATRTIAQLVAWIVQ